MLCGLAGAYLSIAHGAGFGREMSAGKGYIALAAMIFGKWNPIPTLFAFPYGETTDEIIELVKEFKFKVAFGQHSGIINETSNMYYLPRFSLNERYGEIDRVKFAASSKGLGVYDFIPESPTIKQNPPFIGFSLLDDKKAQSLDCFIFDSKGQVDREIYKFNERIEIRLSRELSPGRSRMNCTVKDREGNWRWFGHQFYF